jgi:hypothetical protein
MAKFPEEASAPHNEKREVHPLTEPALFARAEQMAAAAFQAADLARDTPRRRIKRMDEAASAVFAAGGVARNIADFYATAVTADVLERLTR